MTFGFHISYWAVFWELAPYLAIPAGLVLLLFAGTWVSRRSPRNAVRYLLLGVLALLVAFANWTGVLYILPVQAFMVLAMYWMYRMNLQLSAS